MSYIVIQHYQFPIQDPFKEGHVLTELEAGVLNWHRAGLIQKTTQRWIAEAMNGADEILSVEKLDELGERIKEFDEKYELSERKPPKPSSLEFNLRQIAEGLLLLQGHLQYTEEDLERIKRTPEVQARARDLIRSGTFTMEDLLS